MAKKGTRKMKPPDLQKQSNNREYRLGTRYMTEKGHIWKYGKLDFGVLYRTDASKVFRNILYTWFLVKDVPREKTAPAKLFNLSIT